MSSLLEKKILESDYTFLAQDMERLDDGSLSVVFLDNFVFGVLLHQNNDIIELLRTKFTNENIVFSSFDRTLYEKRIKLSEYEKILHKLVLENGKTVYRVSFRSLLPFE